MDDSQTERSAFLRKLERLYDFCRIEGLSISGGADGEYDRVLIEQTNGPFQIQLMALGADGWAAYGLGAGEMMRRSRVPIDKAWGVN